MMFPGYDFGYMGWMMVGVGLFWVAIVGLVVFAIVRLTPRTARDDALAILKERLARGEISIDEYQSSRTLITTT